MNNEEKILEILVQIQGDIAGLKAGQAKLEAGQAQLQEDITEIKRDVKYLWEEADRAGDRLSEHDAAIKKIM